MSLVGRLVERVKDAALHCVCQFAKQGRRLREPPLLSALVVAPSSSGSVGDAALIAGCISELRRKGYQKVVLLVASDNDIQTGSIRPDEVVFVRNLLTVGDRKSRMLFAFTVSRYFAMYVIGADIIDGVYSPAKAMARIRLMQLASSMGVRAVLVGSSISETPNAQCLDALARLPQSVHLNVRDPLSAERLSPRLGRRPAICADAAFLMTDNRAPEVPESVASWLDEMAAGGRLVVALNVHGGKAREHAGLLSAMRQIVARLVSDFGLAILLVPHDSRPPSDVDALQTLAAQFPSSPVRLYGGPMDPQAIRATMTRIPLAITGRMHLAILGLSVGAVPFAITYQGKFEGLYAMFDLPPGRLSVDPRRTIQAPEAVLSLVRATLDNLDQYRSTIRRSLPRIVESARGNVIL